MLINSVFDEGQTEIITTEITLLPQTNSFIDETICPTDTLVFENVELLLPGNYIFQNQSSTGCSGYTYLMLSSLPIADTGLLSLTLCENDSFVLNGIVFNTDHPNGEVLLNNDASNGCDSIIQVNISFWPIFETTDSLILVAGDTFNGIPIFSDTLFNEKLTSINGCDSTIITHISVATPTNHLFKESIDLHIYPNPTSNDLFIEMNLPKAMALEISIFDILGRHQSVLHPLKTYPFGKQVLPFELTNWRSGTYFIKIGDGETWVFRKLVKM